MSYKLLSKSILVLKNEGARELYKKGKRYIAHRLLTKTSEPPALEYVNFWGYNFFNLDDLRELIRSGKFRGVYIMGSLCLGWYDKVKQRHQHIAEYLMKQGYLVICGMNPIHDADYTVSLKRVDTNLVLANFYNRYFLKELMQYIALECSGYKFYHIIGTEPGTTIEELAWIKSLGYTVYYEISDEIDKEIFASLEEKTIKRHDDILKDSDIVVVTTAEKLYQKAIKYRKKNALLSVNAATIEDWIISEDENMIPPEIEVVLNKKKKIVGFYGSFAAWIDYEYIKYLALERPDYEIVMIGYDYERGEGAFTKSRITELNNITIIPVQPYKRLKYFSQFFDVAMVPFRKYELTETVSPVKMFEHMAQKIPVVTIDMYECRKYKEVLVSTTKEEFVKNIDKAIQLKSDKIFSAALYNCASANSWSQRAKEIQIFLEDTQLIYQDNIKKKKKILSLVIPAYNMQKYINRCIDSLLYPAFSDLLEIIIVNDGSKDRTMEFANVYKELWPYDIIIINKENGGHGSCINSGIKIASGKYIKLVDSDDFLDSTELLKHVLYLNSCSDDMVITNYNRFFEDGHIEHVSYSDRLTDRKTYTADFFYQALLKDSSFASYAHMHSITYKTSVLQKNNIIITENSFYVDQEYITYPLKFVKTISYQPIYLYHYFIGRIGQSVDPNIANKRAYMNLNIIRNIKKYLLTIEDKDLKLYIENILFHQTSYWLSCTNDKYSATEELKWWKNEIKDVNKYNTLKGLI